MPISGNIRKFVFDLSLSNDKVFDHLSDELISLTKKRLLEVLEKVLSPLDNSNLVIDKIEIDIGDFDPRDLNGFVRKFKTELENFVDINFNGESLESDERVEAAILFFIKKGYYPWWVDSSQSFNKLILNGSDSLYFSKSLITLILANEKNYFRLLNDFNSEAKRIVYQKLLFGNVVLFNATISFYERLLLNYELPKRDSNIFILNKIEFFLIKQSQDSNDSAIIFFKTLKYFSEFISIPFSKFFRFISEEVIESETDSNIKSFFNSQSVNLIQESKKNNLSIGDTDIDEYKGSLTLESLINYLDKGLFQLNFTRLGEFKKFFDSLLTKRDTTLLNYLNSVSFYQNKEKLARLSALLDESSYPLLILILNKLTEVSEAVSSIERFFKINEKEESLTLDFSSEEEKSSFEEKLSQKEQAFKNNLASLLNYFDRGSLQINYTALEEFKRVFDSLLKKRDTILLNYFSSVSFYQNKEKLARLATLLDLRSYPLLMNFLSESTEESEAISSIGNYIKINDQEKSFTISSKAEKDKSSVEGKLTRQEQSSNNNIETLIRYFERSSVQLNFSSLEEFKSLFESLLEKKDTKLLNYFSSVSFYQNKEKLARLTALLDLSSYQLLIKFLKKLTGVSDAISSIENFIKINDQDKLLTVKSSSEEARDLVEVKSIRLEQSSKNNLKLLIDYFEKGSLSINFRTIEELKKLFDLLLEKRNTDLFNYLTTSSFFQDKGKLSRLISLLTNENYRRLVLFLSKDENKEPSIQFINNFISNSSKEGPTISLLEEVTLELDHEDDFNIRLLSESPLQILVTYFEKGIPQSNFTILSEYSKLFDRLLEQDNKSLIEYISKTSFYQSALKLERLFSLLSDNALQNTINLLITPETKSLISDLDSVFSDSSFIQSVSIYSSTTSLIYSYKKSLLIDLFKSKSGKQSTSAFISSLIENVTKDNSLQRDELLYEISKMGEKKKFKEATSNIFNVLYPKLSAADQEIKSKNQETKSIDSILPFNIEISSIDKLKVKEQEQLLLDMFKKLPQSGKLMEKFIYHPSYTKYASLDLLSNVFKALKLINGVSVLSLIQRVVGMIEKQKKNQYLLIVHRISFQLIVSKGLNVSRDIFLESLLNNLIKLYPQIFLKNKLLNTKSTSADENTLKEIIKKVSERNRSLSKTEELSIDIEKFNSLLQLKQAILENQFITVFPEEKIDLFEDFTSIINSENTLLTFLSQNYLDHELMMAFSEISLQSEASLLIKKIIDQANSSVFELEEELLSIQKQYNIISLNFRSLKIILRTFLLKKIGALNDFKQFSYSKFTIDFLEDIKKENYLNFQQIASYLRSEESKSVLNKLTEPIAIFNIGSKFSITNPKLKNELFYKDLVFYYLETDEIPQWANIEDFNIRDVVVLLKSAINNGDKNYIDKLLMNNKTANSFLTVIKEFSVIELKKLMQLIHLSPASFDLQKLLEYLETLLFDVKLSSSMSNNVFLHHLTIKEELWKQTSLISFIEKIIPFIEEKSKKTKKQIFNFISKEFNLSSKLIQLEKNVKLSDTEIIEVLKYYLEFNRFPKHLNLYSKEVEAQLKQFLLREDYTILELLREYKYKPLELKHLLYFISFSNIIDSFHRIILKDQPISFSLGSTLKEYVRIKKPQNKSIIQLIINLAISFENRVTPASLSEFYKRFKNEDSKNYDEFIKIVLKKSKESSKEELNIQEELINEINFSQQAEELSKKEALDNIDLIDYYLEIGSINFENKYFTKNDLYQILLKSIKEAELRTKKMVFEWVKSKLKLNRLMDIIPKDKSQVLIDLIHSELSKNLILFSKSMEQVLQAPLERLLSLKSQRDLQIKIIQYWLKKSIYLDSPFQLIVHLFDEVLENEKMTSADFFQEFRSTDFEYPLETNNFIYSLKRTYDNYKNQLSEEDILKQEDEVIEQDQDDSDTIIIQNAGLIILWPFFYRLFDKCGYLIDRKFKDDLSIQKGILLMQYLVTGSLKTNENELVLNKILCGVAQRTPIDVKIDIDDIEIEMCDSLLKGVLQNWQKLGNSSVATLRETFLIREGILTRNELDYNLDIVKETFDMLLDTIPWNISMIQTTFMENRIIVDWK